MLAGISVSLMPAAAQELEGAAADAVEVSEIADTEESTDEGTAGEVTADTETDTTDVPEFEQLPIHLEQQLLEQRVLKSETTKRLFRGNYVLKKLRERLLFSSETYQGLDDEIKRVKNKLLFTDLDLNKLNDQVKLLSRQIVSTKRKIKRTETKIIETKARIEELYQKIDILEVRLEDQKNQLSEYLRLIYMHENYFYAINDQSDRRFNILKFLLASTTISETLQRETYLKILEDKGQELVDKLEKTKADLEADKATLDNERMRLEILMAELEGENDNLVAQRTGKKNLMEETEGKQEIFQTLLAQSIIEQEEILEELNAIRTNIDYFNEQLGTLKDRLSPADYEIILRIKTDATERKQGVGSTLRFPIWPVVPKRGLSAYFVDANYRRAFGVEHYAIDVPVVQKTPVLAPANGLVVKVKDRDKGYNYIAVAHEKGVMTVFGHIFESYVDVGDFVHVGEVLGLSGGVPGTRGAGYRTTGAHLHFEVWQDGVRVDPLGYMNLDALSIDYIPAEYLEDLEEKFKDVMDGVFGDEEASSEEAVVSGEKVKRVLEESVEEVVAGEEGEAVAGEVTTDQPVEEVQPEERAG